MPLPSHKLEPCCSYFWPQCKALAKLETIAKVCLSVPLHLVNFKAVYSSLSYECCQGYTAVLYLPEMASVDSFFFYYYYSKTANS